MEVKIGDLIENKYRVVRLLGEGGMGAVYEGENTRIHHRVAIKVLHPTIATNAAVVERFEREAQAAGKIGSEHIVAVYDLGDLGDGGRYMVMEYLDGENLAARIHSSTRIAPATIAPMLLQLLDGLGAAHSAGIVHRDLKPENIFLVRHKSGQDFVKIVDFGVSKFNSVAGAAEMSMTRTGSVLGTPYYMSPEQAKGAKATDLRSDLYSVGVVLFECATGQVPFQADTFNELMFKIALEEAPDPAAVVPGMDPIFSGIIKKAMSRDPVQRYQTAIEFQDAILDWMKQQGLSTSFVSKNYSSSRMGSAATEPPGVGSPFSTSTPGAAAGSAQAKTSSFTGSIPNVASSVGGIAAAKKSSRAPIVAGAVVLLIAAAAGVFLTVSSRKTTATASAGEVHETKPVVAATTAVPEPAPVVAPAPVAPVAAATATNEADAGAPVATVATVHAPTRVNGTKPVFHAVAAPPTPSATASSKANVRGRTIREQL